MYVGSHCDNSIVWIQLFPHPRGPRQRGVWVLVHGLPDRSLCSHQVGTVQSFILCQLSEQSQTLVTSLLSYFQEISQPRNQTCKTFLPSYNLNETRGTIPGDPLSFSVLIDSWRSDKHRTNKCIMFSKAILNSSETIWQTENYSSNTIKTYDYLPFFGQMDITHIISLWTLKADMASAAA